MMLAFFLAFASVFRFAAHLWRIRSAASGAAARRIYVKRPDIEKRSHLNRGHRSPPLASPDLAHDLSPLAPRRFLLLSRQNRSDQSSCAKQAQTTEPKGIGPMKTVEPTTADQTAAVAAQGAPVAPEKAPLEGSRHQEEGRG